jgi:hypothetical protein
MFNPDSKLFLELFKAVPVEHCGNAIKVNPPLPGRWRFTIDHLQKFSRVDLASLSQHAHLE